jgi:hypothetical protein
LPAAFFREGLAVDGLDDDEAKGGSGRGEEAEGKGREATVRFGDCGADEGGVGVGVSTSRSSRDSSPTSSRAGRSRAAALMAAAIE